MPLDRVPFSKVRPTWANPSSHMTVRYVAHPSLRLAFVQVADEPMHVYVVSDEPLPGSFDEAVAVVAKWRTEHGKSPAA